ncbi:hypothetical protein HOU00_gp450 [Caulobacter phage CcrPW]|uniref:Nucleotide-diphospho-sugar transferase domain-containing protein n=1 Tax=Caulobacter phage CcrPW TaxID=2283271 RepID=A0A385ECE2_9CAUD|nr:hypothetical protein HOU00_gp450 [Caulobacter phage CcrPW]AXQ68675.1 hypothetical protein CcrPW_gp136 [Caulobacter phage CcrPW]
MTLHVFVGYDIREHAAWMVCRDSLLNPIAYEGDAPLDVQVHPVSHRELRRAGVFDRPWRIDEKGQTWDERDGRPFSTEFSHSRFLVPSLAQAMGLTGQVVFVDCDFMFMHSVVDMVDALDPTKLVSVVKHDFERIAAGTKMDGMSQSRYYRKLWSSLMVFNLDHEDAHLFHPHYANTWDGSSLHGFQPLTDAEIGDIPSEWNHIPGHSSANEVPSAIHWSFGGPWMPAYEKAAWAPLWRARYVQVMQDALTDDISTTFPIL